MDLKGMYVRLDPGLIQILKTEAGYRGQSVAALISERLMGSYDSSPFEIDGVKVDPKRSPGISKHKSNKRSAGLAAAS